MAKKYIILCLCLLCSFAAFAQDQVFLFDDFTKGVFHLKGNIKTKGEFNIDAKGQRIYYLLNGQTMEMTNMDQLLRIEAAGREFVIKDNALCEKVAAENCTVFINWRLRESYVGRVGAMGLTTQAKVDVVEVPGLNSEYSLNNMGKFEDVTQVWDRKNENVYYVTAAGKEYKFRNPQDIYRAFPKRKAEIKEFIHTNNYTMETSNEALKILNFVFDTNE